MQAAWTGIADGVRRSRRLLAGLGLLFGGWPRLLEVGVRILHLVPDRFWEPDAHTRRRR